MNGLLPYRAKKSLGIRFPILKRALEDYSYGAGSVPAAASRTVTNEWLTSTTLRVRKYNPYGRAEIREMSQNAPKNASLFGEDGTGMRL